MSGRPNYATLVPNEQGEALVYEGSSTKWSGTTKRFSVTFREEHDSNSGRSNEATISGSLEEHES